MKRWALLTVIAVSSIGCVGQHGSAIPGWYTPSGPADPNAKFGILLEANTTIQPTK